MVSAGSIARDAEPVEAYIATIQSAGLGSEQDARSQVFAPTCCPEQINIAPGIVMRRPQSPEYAPNLDIAESKITALRGLARTGKVAVINITMEPGMGKTIHLPFKFSDSKVMVVLPTVFDAWSAKLTAPNPAILTSFGYTSDIVSNVTYTDSYYAAYLISTGGLAGYDMVFIDESHSADGVTTFMASAVVPGISFIRMTATPKSIRTQPRRSFPIIDELSAPELSNVQAVGEFVINRAEFRKLVMTPSPQAAELVAGAIPGSVLLTKKSSPSDILRAMNNQDMPATIVTDASCSKGINLNLDFVLDFASIETPTGTRKITIPEQQQRRARVGRSRPGVYCCSYRATSDYYEDQFSLFRSNLWCLINSLDTFPCDISSVTRQRAFKLLRLVTEPALVPHESPILSSSSSSVEPDYVSLDGKSTPITPTFSRDIQIEDDAAKLSIEDHSDQPAWVSYYVRGDNHPNVYTGDMIFDHRSLTRKLTLGPDMPIKPASNFVSSVDEVVTRPGTSRVYSSNTGAPVMHRRLSSSGRSGETTADRFDRKLTRAKSTPVEQGAPLRLKRGTRVFKGRMGTAYKALSISGDHIVESGIVLAESQKVHNSLRPLPSNLANALSSPTADRDLGRATSYLTWTVARPLNSVNIEEQIAMFSAVDAWSIPAVSEIPVIDLQVDYHLLWSSVLTERVRNKQVLPIVVPAVGWPRRSIKCASDNLLITALDICDDPAYNVSEQQLVYKAWNILAAKSSFVAPCSSQVYHDANSLLAYMVSADRLQRIS